MRPISDPRAGDESEDEATHRVRARLAAAPRRPDDVSRFTPDLYPDGPPLVPAAGDPPDADAAVVALDAAGVPGAAERFADPRLVARAPDPEVRAGLVALAGTVAAPVLDAFAAGALAVDRVVRAPLTAPGRVVGPVAGEAWSTRAVNDRYRAEHPVLLAPSLAHDLLWNPAGAGKVEETLLHAVAAMVHVERIAAAPALADLRTELARRQHSLAITLLLSRHRGSADVCLVAPDGAGTLPGGAPALATPDFWSVPFGTGESADPDAPAVLAAVLARAFGADAPVPRPLRYDAAVVALCTLPLASTWCPAPARLGAAVALGLVDP